MKVIIFIAALLTLTSCGSGGGGSSGGPRNGGLSDKSFACGQSSLLGSWNGAVLGNNDTMTLRADCSGESSYCQSTFVYPNIAATTGTILINVLSTNSKTGCLPVGETRCTYSLENAQLAFNCGGLTLMYQKQ